ncbi:cobalt ECF transporter T component CbiQ [Priestia megaterium]|nr:cobalt ECF transporter T component CbiQ [Priestia megaterium]
MLLIDKYAYFNKLQHVHPIEKITFAIGFLLFSLIVQDVLVSLITFIVMSAFTIFIAKIPFRYYLKLLFAPSFFLLSGIITILFSFTYETITVPSVWQTAIGNIQIYIGQDSMKQAVTLLFVVSGSISCLYFLILTTPLSAILDVLRKLKVPSLFIEIVALTYRFIFVFFESATMIYQAQSSRLGYTTIRQSIRSLGMLISMLFFKVFQKTSQLSMAMNSRGYEENLVFIEPEYPYSIRNWIIIASLFISLTVVYFVTGGHV